jgi:glycerol kinase
MDVLLQLQADVLDVPVARPAVLETTALGAARLAGIAEGLWTDVTFADAATDGGARFTPGDTGAAEAGYGRWRRAVERSLKWAVAESLS